LTVLCVFAVLGVFALNQPLQKLVPRKGAKDRKDAKVKTLLAALLIV
jgi:hypothetical protein